MGFFSQQQTWSKATGHRVKGRYSMGYFSFLLLLMVMGVYGAALAQGPEYKRGRAATPDEIKAWDISISPDGKELPRGSGTAQQGARIYAQKCAYCHGATGTEAKAPPPILRRDLHRPPLNQVDRTIIPAVVNGGRETELTMGGRVGVWRWPFATTIWDYINRAMPRTLPGAKKWIEGSLSADEVYALTAWILSQNGIIKQGDVMDAKTLPQVQMPERFTHPAVPK